MKLTSVPALITAVAAATLIGGGAGFWGVHSLGDAPRESDYVVELSTRQVPATVHDPDDVLNGEEEQRLAAEVVAPDVVTHLTYLVFAENDDNVNDTVENYVRDNLPHLLAPDDDHFADGSLIVGVGLDPRQAFVFAGEDVAQQLRLREGNHLDTSINAIKPDVEDGHIAEGLISGARAATDPEKIAQDSFAQAQSDRLRDLTLATIAGGGLAGTATALGGLRARSRRQKVDAARADFHLTSTEYAALAQRLDHIDIRAHSLSSPLVNDELRAQWADVQRRFLDIHERVGAVGPLTSSSPDKVFYQQAGELAEAAEVTRQVSYAEENIDTLFKLEHGDTATREQEIQALHSDILEARLEVDSTTSPIYAHLTEIKDRAAALSTDTQHPQFLEEFLFLLRDYQAALTEINERQFSDVEPAEELRAPRLYDKDYRPGYGVNGFVPFWVMSSWHSNNVAASQASQSSTNSTFSSGFSGAGGSSSF